MRPPMFHAVTPPPENPSRDDIIWLAGPRLLGLIFNWSLLGVLTIQVYIYHINFPKDRRFLKFLGELYFVYILDWVQTCSATYDAFQWFVYGWGNIPVLYGLFTTFLNVPILSSIVAAIVQIFFGWRIWALSESRITCAVIVFLSLLQLGGGGAVGYYIYNDASEVARSEGLVRAVGIRLGGSAVVDSVIAIFMTLFLVRSRGQGLSYTDSVLTRLIRLTIETGTVTAISAIVDLVFFLKAHNGLHQVSGVILCKMYSNTLLVLFNNRLMRTNETSVHEVDLAFRGASSRQHHHSDVEWNSRPTVDLDSVELRDFVEKGMKEEGGTDS
ncbi:putative Transmembrane protein [Mycena venus]|uniref:Putative Transmembrane protein n=1 Tax=Mycena venus TaxID=2733690 RepID=A0A8H6Z4F8_9AGAR|nr:putative Transmembrane protein [Mycena venus]